MSDELPFLDDRLVEAVTHFGDLDTPHAQQAYPHWMTPQPTVLRWAQSRLSRHGTCEPQSQTDQAGAAFSEWQQSVNASPILWLQATQATLKVVERLVTELTEQRYRPSGVTLELVADAQLAVAAFGSDFPTAPEALPLFVGREVADPVDATLELIREQLTKGASDLSQAALTVGGWLMFRRMVLWLLEGWQPEIRQQRPTPCFTTTARVLIAVLSIDKDLVTESGRVGEVSVEVEHSSVAGAFLDPVSLGLIEVNQPFVISVQRAWEYARRLHVQERPDAALPSVCLSPQWQKPMQSIGGGSAGGLFAAAVVAGLKRIALNEQATATIVVKDDVGGVMPVADDSLEDKLKAAREGNVLHVVVEADQAQRFAEVAKRRKITLHGAETLNEVVTYLASDFVEIPPAALRRLATVPPPDPNFRGRKQQLLDTHAALTQRRQLGATQFAYWGYGGLGKTSLATAYVWKYWREWPDGIFFLDGPRDPVDQLISLWESLELGPRLETRDDLLAAVLAKLNRSNDWLLILDNVDSVEQWTAWNKVLKRLPQRHVLFTTRMEDLPGVDQMLQISPMLDDEGRQLLAARREDALEPVHVDAANELIEWLHGHALGLSLAAAFLSLRSNRDRTWRAYVDDLKSRPHPVFVEVDGKAVPYLATDYEHRVLQVFDDLYATLSPNEQRLLQYAAILPEGGIVRDWLPDLFNTDPEFKSPSGSDAGAGSCQPLVEHLFHIRILSERSARLWSLHNILRTRLRELATAETTAPKVAAMATVSLGWARSVHECLCDRFDHAQDDDIDPLVEVIQLLREHNHWYASAEAANRLHQPFEQLVRFRDAERVLLPFTDEAVADHVGPLFAVSLNNLALLLLATNRLSEAEPLIQRALEIVKRTFGDTNTLYANTLNNLAALLQHTNRQAEAEPLIRRALAIDEQFFGSDHPNIAKYLNNLAQLLQATNRLAESEPMMRRVLKIDEQSFGNAHPNIARGLNNLAQLLQATNRLAEAEPLMRRALEIDERVFGNAHPIVATDLTNLAGLLEASNRLADAEALMRHALEINEHVFGKGHPNVAGVLNNLGLLLQTTNRLAEAEPLLRRALAIHEQSFGPNHPKVAISLNSLAELFKFQDHFSEAERLTRRALEIHELSSGNAHPNVATALNNLAALLQTKNRLAEAEPLLGRALAIDERSFGPVHPNVARDLNNLAQVLQATNRLTEAEPLMRRALAIDEQSYGVDHPDVASKLNNLAQLLKDMNRLSEVEPMMRRAATIDQQSFGNSHPKVARDLANLAQFLQATNRLAEAEPLMRRALEIDEQSFGNSHSVVAIDLNNLARLLQETNHVSEAEPLMRRALTINEELFGPTHTKVAINLNNLAQLLKNTNRLAEAEPMMRRALEIWEDSLGRAHPDVAVALINLAALFQATNRNAEAEPLIRRALQIDEQSYCTEHPVVARDLNNLAQLLQDMNRLSEAEPLMRRALEIDKQSLGDAHPDVAIGLNNLAVLLHATNRSSDAELLMRRALEIDEQSYGNSHPAVARDLNNLVQVLQAANRHQEAEPLMRRVVEIFRNPPGEPLLGYATALNNLAVLLIAMNRLSEAGPLLRRALEIDLQSFDNAHPNVARDLYNLNQLLRKLGETSSHPYLGRLLWQQRMQRAVKSEDYSLAVKCRDEIKQLDQAHPDYESEFGEAVLRVLTLLAPLRCISEPTKRAVGGRLREEPNLANQFLEAVQFVADELEEFEDFQFQEVVNELEFVTDSAELLRQLGVQKAAEENGVGFGPEAWAVYAYDAVSSSRTDRLLYCLANRFVWSPPTRDEALLLAQLFDHLGQPYAASALRARFAQEDSADDD